MSEKYIFKVGDECELMGVPGRIVAWQSERVCSLLWRSIDLWRYIDRHNEQWVTLHGKMEPWHKEPALKLIKPAKRVVKKRYQMMATKICEGWCGAGALVDENFRDSSGRERFPDRERKLMENSPYIEIEVEEDG
jgi:hypothetical protein